MPYKCYFKDCGLASKSDVKCSHCGRVFMKQVPYIDDEAEQEEESSETLTYDIINDTATQQQFGMIITKNRRSQKGLDKVKTVTTNGSGGGNGAQTGASAKTSSVWTDQKLAEAKEKRKGVLEKHQKAVKKNVDWNTQLKKRQEEGGNTDYATRQVNESFKAANEAKEELDLLDKEITEAEEMMRGETSRPSTQQPPVQQTTNQGEQQRQQEEERRQQQEQDRQRQQQEQERARQQQEQERQRQQQERLRLQQEEERRRIQQEEAARREAEARQEQERSRQQQERLRQQQEQERLRQQQEQERLRIQQEEERRRIQQEETARREAEMRQQSEQQVATEQRQATKKPEQKNEAKPKRTDQQQIDRLRLAQKEQEALRNLKTKRPVLGEGAEAALVGLAELIDNAEKAVEQGRAQKISEAELAIAQALPKISEAELAIAQALPKISEAEKKVAQANALIQQAGNAIQAADAKANQAQLDHKQAEKDLVAQITPLQKEISAIAQEIVSKDLNSAANINKYMQAQIKDALASYNDDRNLDACLDTLQETWNTLKGQFKGETPDTQSLAEGEVLQARGNREEAAKTKAEAEAEKFQAETAEANAKAQKRQGESEKANAEAQKREAETEKANAEAQKRRAEIDKSNAENEVAENGAGVEEARMKAQKAAAKLTTTLRFGSVSKSPVDPDTVVGLSAEEKQKRKAINEQKEKASAAVLKDFKDYPDLVTSTLDIIQEAEHPEVFLKGIAEVGKLLQGNFGDAAQSPREASKMAKNALKMAGLVGGDYLTRMTKYYETAGAKALKDPDPLRDNTQNAKDSLKLQKTTLNYTGALGGAMLGTDGKINTTSEAANNLRDRLQFHPDSLKDPMPNLVRHLETFRKNMENPEVARVCNEAVQSVKAPSTQITKNLVKNSLSQTDGDAGNQKGARKAILSAALTPLTQGPAGSCFTTCNCMDYQEQKPEAFLKDLAEIVNTGKLVKNGQTVEAPIISKLPPNENALLRCQEATTATLGASKGNSDRKDAVKSNVNNALIDAENTLAYKNMSKARAKAQREYTAADRAYNLDPSSANNDKRNEKVANLNQALADWPAKRDRLKDAAKDAFVFEYNPAMARSGTANDGNSTKGGWELRSAANNAKITTPAELQTCLKTAFKTALGDDGDEREIENLLKDNSPFMTGFLGAYSAEGSIFAHGVGGMEEFSKEVLAGQEVETKKVATPTATATAADKTKGLLAGMVESLKESTDEKVTLGIAGTHAERALPKHPSLDVLKTGGNVKDKVEEIFGQCETVATTPMEEDKVKYLFEKSIDAVLKDYVGNRNGDFTPQGQGPSGKQTPADLKTLIMNGVSREALAQRWQDPDVARDILEKKIDTFLLKELFPQFVIADTNWGNAKGKDYHVIAPDLETGKPKLYVQESESGDLKPADKDDTADGEKWIDKEWGVTTVKK